MKKPVKWGAIVVGAIISVWIIYSIFSGSHIFKNGW